VDETGNEAPASGLAKLRLLAATPRAGRGFWYGVAIDLLWPVIMLFSRPVWRGRRHIPQSGPVLLVTNHLSSIDPITVTAFVLASGRIPRYLAKTELWRARLVRRVMADGRHIAVDRQGGGSGGYRQALRALSDGECVAVFPEGTFTDDPDGWPMTAQPGAARMALRTGAPVVPVAHWGGQRFLPPEAKFPRLLPRATIHISAGPPVDLDDLRGSRLTAEVLDTANKRIMAAVTALLADIRGARPPA
jgi:1-acyl-sn-glycerol-3-phosphate acyltransferase